MIHRFATMYDNTQSQSTWISPKGIIELEVHLNITKTKCFFFSSQKSWTTKAMISQNWRDKQNVIGYNLKNDKLNFNVIKHIWLEDHIIELFERTWIQSIVGRRQRGIRRGTSPEKPPWFSIKFAHRSFPTSGLRSGRACLQLSTDWRRIRNAVAEGSGI